MPDGPAATTNGAPAATVDPAKAQADLAKAQAEARKAAADANAAETTASKSRREEIEASSATGIAERDAKRAQAIAEAKRDAATARQAEISSLIPDFTKIERGKLGVSGDVGIAGSTISYEALSRAAHQVGERTRHAIGDPSTWRILVTSETDLAAGDAAYHDVNAGLAQLRASGEEFLALPLPEPPSRETVDRLEPGQDTPRREFAATLGAVATALPGLLSLFAADRTVSSAAVTMTDFAAAAAVAGDLKGNMETGPVFHDTLRPLPSSQVAQAAGQVLSVRQRLVARKLELDALRAAMTSEQTRLGKLDDDQAKALAGQGANTNAIQAERARIAARLDVLDGPLASAASQAAMADNLLAAIDRFTASMNAVPAGGRVSPLTAAALHEGLHVASDKGGFTHLLLVKAEAASSAQLVNDRPLWRKDTFSILGAASITYTLLKMPSGEVQKSGVESATAIANGKIGGTFAFDE